MRLSTLWRNASPDQDAPTCPSFVLDVGEGKFQDSCTSFIGLTKSVLDGSDVHERIGFEFPDLRSKYCDKSLLSERTVLTTRNANVEALNNFVGDMILGSAKQYVSAERIDNPAEHELRYPVELLNNIPGTDLIPDHQASLQKGYVVMLLQNL